MTITKTFAVAAAVALVATPLAAKPLFDPPKDAVTEVVRPSAFVPARSHVRQRCRPRRLNHA